VSGTTGSPAASQSAANERAFADALATPANTVPAQIVAGPVVTAYIGLEAGLGAGYAAAGPYAAESVAQILGGYQTCEPNGGQCSSSTGFTTKAAGQITGVSVNGQPVAGRVASGTDSSLEVSDVFAYRLTESADTVAVTSRIQDDSYAPINTSPAVLASLITPDCTVQYNAEESELPVSLSPRASVYGFAVFATKDVTGTSSCTSMTVTTTCSGLAPHRAGLMLSLVVVRCWLVARRALTCGQHYDSSAAHTCPWARHSVAVMLGRLDGPALSRPCPSRCRSRGLKFAARPPDPLHHTQPYYSGHSGYLAD
jgi:hypothetical protein